MNWKQLVALGRLERAWRKKAPKRLLAAPPAPRKRAKINKRK